MKDCDPGHREPTQAALQALMAHETALYADLADGLEQERQALIALQEEALFQAVQTKEAILGRLLAVREKRRACLRELGWDDKAGNPAISWLGPLVSAHQQHIADLSARVAATNGRNRALIEEALEIVQKFTDLLREAESGPRTYQPQGLVAVRAGIPRFTRRA